MRLVSLVPFDGREPSASAGDALALETWAAVTAVWHPAILGCGLGLPEIESITAPSDPAAGEIRVIPRGAVEQLPSGHRTSVEDAGAILIEASSDRAVLVARVRGRLGDPGANTAADAELDRVAHDFLALGLAHWMLRELTAAMGHADTLDRESLLREVQAGAYAWRTGDAPAAVNRLRAAFEILTQARERFYPVDAYLLDLCMLNPLEPAQGLAAIFETPVPVSLLAQAKTIDDLAASQPELLESLRQGIAGGWVDVAGGEYDEAPNAVLPIESLVWRFVEGGETYRRHLDDRSVETFARRRFGLHTMAPQIAKRFGFRFALHMGFDAGVFPIPGETKRMWEGPDGVTLEALVRPPLAADRAMTGWQLPWRIAATMKNDHVATVPLLHWARPVAPWYHDLRRSASYSPVLGRFFTLGDYFENTDRPYESLRPEPDSYQTPFLAQAVLARETAPVSGIAQVHALRGAVESARAMHSLARALLRVSGSDAGMPSSPALEALEREMELEPSSDTAAKIRDAAVSAGTLLARALAASQAETMPEPVAGWLVINPLATGRKASVILPDAPAALAVRAPVLAAQLVEEGVAVVVDLPPLGFAWIARTEETADSGAADDRKAHAREGRLGNDALHIELDERTGGIRGVFGPGEQSARLGQQLVIHGLGDDRSAGSRMIADACTVDYAGPAVAQLSSRGTLVDSTGTRRLASFHQRFRLWTGRPILELAITLDELEPAWLEAAAKADPWRHYLACRWAWPGSESMIRRVIFGAAEITESERPETPEGIDISSRKERTLILPGGLPYHRRHGARMLDTLLIAGSEAARSFRLGVALEIEYPAQCARDFLVEPIVVPCDRAPSRTAAGWLARVDAPGAAITRVEFLEPTDDEGFGLAFHLLETASRPTRTRLRLFANPKRARQVDFQGEIIIELKVEEDTVHVDLTQHELARVVVTF